MGSVFGDPAEVNDEAWGVFSCLFWRIPLCENLPLYYTSEWCYIYLAA
jgi:hypothetical protein